MWQLFRQLRLESYGAPPLCLGHIQLFAHQGVKVFVISLCCKAAKAGCLPQWSCPEFLHPAHVTQLLYMSLYSLRCVVDMFFATRSNFTTFSCCLACCIFFTLLLEAVCLFSCTSDLSGPLLPRNFSLLEDDVYTAALSAAFQLNRPLSYNSL